MALSEAARAWALWWAPVSLPRGQCPTPHSSASAKGPPPLPEPKAWRDLSNSTCVLNLPFQPTPNGPLQPQECATHSPTHTSPQEVSSTKFRLFMVACGSPWLNAPHLILYPQAGGFTSLSLSFPFYPGQVLVKSQSDNLHHHTFPICSRCSKHVQ